jgi:acetyl-CoA carboxylase biotin carboxyl carrier protein
LAEPVVAAAAPVASNHKDVKSPMVGTFYRAPSPEAAPFVEVGQTVEVGQVVCIVEAMKLMNEIKSDVRGKVVEICVDNTEPVEFGQVLLRVDPAK